MNFNNLLQKITILIIIIFVSFTPAQSQSSDNLEELVKQLKSDRAFIREQAAESLGYLGDPKAIAPLIEALKDPDKSVSDAAAQALENYDDPSAEKALNNR